MGQIQVRRGTTAQWTTANPILAVGEPGYDTTLEVFKVGNGTDHWLDLTAAEGGGLDQATADARYAPVSHEHPPTAISDLTEYINDAVAALIKAGSNVTTSYDDDANTFTINATSSGGGSTDPEVVRDTIGGALVAGSGISVTVNDAADTITIAVAGVPQSSVSGLTTSLTALQTNIDAKYTKPGTGIPKTDLIAAVQTSLGKADTALQKSDADLLYAPVGSGGSSTRTAAFSVTNTPGSSAQVGGAPTEVNQRIPAALPVATTRWRLGITTRSIAANGSVFAAAGVGYGTPVLNALGKEDGRISDFTSVSGAFNIPGDSYWMSPWITDAAKQWKPNVPRMMTLGYTIPANGTYPQPRGRAFWKTAVGQAAVFSDLAQTDYMATDGMFVDMFIEYEFTGSQRVVAHWGPSTDAGVRAPGQGSSPTEPGVGGHELWSSVLARKCNLAVANASIGGATLADFGTANYRQQRIPSSVTPFITDLIIGPQAINDMSTGADLVTIQSRFAAVIATAKAMYPALSRIWATNLPSFGRPGSLIRYIMAAGATTFTADLNLGAIPVRLGDGPFAENRTVSAVSGTGPFVHTIPATTNAHLPGEPVYEVGIETIRRQYNSWIQELPHGITGVIDLDGALANPAQPSTTLRQFSEVDNVHWRPAAHTAIAARTSI